MTKSQHYLKIVEWSEDHCFVGQCPGIVGPSCHGNDEIQSLRGTVSNRRRMDYYFKTRTKTVTSKNGWKKYR